MNCKSAQPSRYPPPMEKTEIEWREALSAEADKCVLCGLCSQACPTYGLYREEGESPRGRIVLMQAWLQGRAAADGRWRAHLDHCLGCRACEARCPSGVAYGALLDGVRALAGPPPPTLVDRLAEGIVRWRRLVPLLRTAQRLHLLPRPSTQESVPPLPHVPKWRRRYPARGERRGTVGLLLGCVASLWDADTLSAAIDLLTRCGYEVVVPREQGCCGALAWHDGRRGRGRDQARALVAAFSEVEAVLSTATGCTAHLRDYGRVLGEAGADFARRVAEVGEWLERGRLGPWVETPARVALHVPCTQANVLRRPDLYRALLEGLPGVDVVPLTAGHGCCGAAGSRVLHEPDQARALRAPLLEAVRSMAVDEVLTANVGCRLHLAAGLREAGVDIPVRHPLAFLADRLGGT